MSGYLNQFDQWVRQHRSRLEASGKVDYTEWFNKGSDNPAAQLIVLREHAEVELLLWESGDAELTYGPVTEAIMEHHDVGSLGELDRLLTRFSECVSAIGPGPALPA